jgi:hypothetical protein
MVFDARLAIYQTIQIFIYKLSFGLTFESKEGNFWIKNHIFSESLKAQVVVRL